MHAPFAPQFPIRSLDDVRRLEQTPLDQALPVRSTYEVLCNTARAFGEKVALTFLCSAEPGGEAIRWTYAELLRGIHQTANVLHALGVRPDDAVAVLLPGCLEYHLALWGGEAAAIVQPLNPLLSDEKLVSLMNAGRAKVLIAWGGDDESGMWSKAMRIHTQVPTLCAVLRVAPHDERAPPVSLPQRVFDFAALRASEPAERLVSGRRIERECIAAYFHTGGTTGAPKLARHSHGAQVFTAWANVQLWGSSATDVTINGYPLFHVAGVLPASLSALACGMQTVIPTTGLFRNRQVITNHWRLVEHHRATLLSAVPTVLAALANVPLDADISSIRACRTGAAPLPPELAARFEQQFGVHVHECFGMTEMAGISSITPPGVTAPPGCVGFRLPYSQVRIVALDAQGGASERDLAIGETGMVLFKSPNLFSGFVDPQDNAKAFTADGWLATGDLGWMDAQGRLHLAGRSKDLIIRSGHNIDPKVVEDALGAHPAVQFVAAVGAPDAYAGELPVTFVTLRPGASVSEAELLDFAAARVDEAPARPKRVIIVESMPMTNVGKIYKPQLRMLAAHDVVARLVTEACQDLGVNGAARPQVLAAEGQGVTVVLNAAALGPRVAPLRQRLHALLSRLPIKTDLRLA
jgi:fatty-acyl-CoA synthase